MAYISIAIALCLLVTFSNAALFSKNDQPVDYADSLSGALITSNGYNDRIGNLKRSFGINCMLTISGCFTTTQAERYRKYMENVRFLPK